MKQINVNIIVYLLKRNRLACLFTYFLIRNEYSGRIHYNQFKELPAKLGTSRSNVSKKIDQLIELGLLRKHRKGWYSIVGAKAFNITHGFMHAKMVKLPKFKNLKELRKFAKQVRVTMAVNHVKTTQKKRGSVPLSCTYLSRFMGCSVSTAWRHRKTLKVTNRHVIIKVGGKDVLHEAILARRNEPRYRIWKDSNLYYWILTLPSEVHSDLKFKKRKFRFTKAEKDHIRFLYYKRFLS